ncbi:MAG: hypothetical protein AAGF95_09040 [Chloroflexota bacterium]
MIICNSGPHAWRMPQCIEAINKHDSRLASVMGMHLLHAVLNDGHLLRVVWWAQHHISKTPVPPCGSGTCKIAGLSHSHSGPTLFCTAALLSLCVRADGSTHLLLFVGWVATTRSRLRRGTLSTRKVVCEAGGMDGEHTSRHLNQGARFVHAVQHLICRVGQTWQNSVHG